MHIYFIIHWRKFAFKNVICHMAAWWLFQCKFRKLKMFSLRWDLTRMCLGNPVEKKNQHFSSFLVPEMTNQNLTQTEIFRLNLDGLVHDCNISIANALEILQYWTKPSICCLYQWIEKKKWMKPCGTLYAHIDGLVQDCSNSIANTLELLQSGTKPLMYMPVKMDQHWFI